MHRVSHLLFALVVCFAAVFVSTLYARIGTAAQDDPCRAPNIRTDVRPDTDGKPTKVSVGVRMEDLMEINDINQTLSGDFIIVLRWEDPRLSQLNKCEVPLSEIWSPGLVFINSGRKFANRPKEVNIGPGGRVEYIQRYSGAFATYHNLKDFPFDKQTFRISLIPLELSEKDIQLVVDKDVTGRRALLNISDWDIKGVDGTIGRQYIAFTNRYYPRYDFNISASRVEAYYVWKTIIPLCLIVAMSWCVFWINPAQFGTQIGLSATSMLTLIAFIFATTNMVPRLGYLTVLDRFIVASTILVFLALVESLSTTYLVSQEKKELAMRMDKVSRVLFPIAFGAIIIAILIL